MCRFILDVNDEFGTTIALIEHDMGVVMDICDHVVVLDYGRKIADGTPEQVRKRPGRARRLPGSGPRWVICSRALVAPFKEIAGVADLPRRGAASAASSPASVLAGGAGLRADLQGLGRVQLRPGRDGAVRRPHAGRAHGARRAGGAGPGPDHGGDGGAGLRHRALVLRPLVNQEYIILFMATIGLNFFLEGFGEMVWGANVKKLDVGIPDRSFMVSGRADQPARADGGDHRRGAGDGAGGVLPAHADRAGAARGGRRPRGRALDRHPAQDDLGGGVVGGRAGGPRGRRHVGRQERRAVQPLADRAQGAAGPHPGRLHLGAGRHRRRAHHRRRARRSPRCTGARSSAAPSKTGSPTSSPSASSSSGPRASSAKRSSSAYDSLASRGFAALKTAQMLGADERRLRRMPHTPQGGARRQRRRWVVFSAAAGADDLPGSRPVQDAATPPTRRSFRSSRIACSWRSALVAALSAAAAARPASTGCRRC